MLSALMLSAVSCNDAFDDSLLWEKINNHENRIAALEELCKQMNTNITSLQKIVNALQNNDYVTNVAPITKDGEIIGYTITFTKSDPITIYLGKDGIDGTNGKDGKDGHTPIIGVKQDTDNLYYWTVDGEWLLDSNGNKIKAQSVDGEDGKDGIDGTDGTNGTNGITPRLKIENDYWWVSYDNGSTWEQLDKATGENNDSFFNDVYIENGYVNFILKDQIIKIAYISDEAFVLVCKQEGDIQKKLTDAQKRSITHLIVDGYIADSDVRYIGDQMLALEILDLRKTTITKVPDYAFCKGELKYGKESLREVYLPETCTSIGQYAFYGCINLRILDAPNVIDIDLYAISYCDIGKMIATLGEGVWGHNCKIRHLEYPRTSNIAQSINTNDASKIDTIFCHKGITMIGTIGTICSNVIFEEPASIKTIESRDLRCQMSKFILPTSVEIIEGESFSGTYLKTLIIPKGSKLVQLKSNIDNYNYYNHGPFSGGAENADLSIICFLSTPPKTSKLFYKDYKSNGSLYVPKKSISLYKNSNWNGQFANIIAIEDSEYRDMQF